MLRYYFCIFLIISYVNGQSNIEEKTLEELIAEANAAEKLDPNTETEVVNVDDDKNVGNDCVNGECVEHYLCLSNQTLNKYGAFVIDDRFGGDSHPKQCHYLETCCAENDRTRTPRKPNSVKREGCGNRYVNGIGIQNVGHINTYSQFGELPWTVAILKEEILLGEKISSYIACGSLIHPSVILTTAHNIYKSKAEQLIIRAGEWDTQTEKEPYPHQQRKVTEIIMHSDFYKPANLNDIALLILDHPVDLSDHIQTVCLPPAHAVDFDMNNCIATGWGKDNFGAIGVYQSILKKIVLPIVSREDCEKDLRTTRLSHHFELHPSFICAGGIAGIDTCTGDGGSPLVCPVNGKTDRYYQVGIVSWGLGCKTTHPGVYVNMPYFKDWIDQQFHQRNLDTNYYTLAN